MAASSETTGDSGSFGHLQQQQQQRARNMVIAYVRLGFRSYGEFLASQPREILVGTIVLVISILTYCNSLTNDAKASSFFVGLVASGMSALALCYLYYDFRKIQTRFRGIEQSGGSTVITRVSIGYVIVTFSLYTIVVYTVGGPDTSILAGWFLIPLLNDPQCVALVAQIVMCSSHPGRISENLASAMYLHGPTFFLNSVNKMLLFAFGFYLDDSGPFCWLKIYGWYAVVSVSVIFVVYFTIFPAALSVMLDLWLMEDGPRWYDNQKILKSLGSEDGYSPAVQKFRVALFAIFLIPHLLFALPEFYTVNQIASYLTRAILTATVIAFACYYHFKDDVDEASAQRRIYLEERRIIQLRNSGSIDEREDEEGSGVPLVVGDSCDEGISVGNEAHSGSSRNSQWSDADDRRSNITISQESQTELKLLKNEIVEKTKMAEKSKVAAPVRMEVADSEESLSPKSSDDESEDLSEEPKSLEDCKEILRISGMKKLNDAEIGLLLKEKVVKAHELEGRLERNYMRAVKLRRSYVETQTRRDLSGLPCKSYEYDKVFGACCESVIGYVPVPVGVVGPINLDGISRNFPMATTEGCLIASVNRGCAALRKGGVKSVVLKDGMSRSPLVSFPDITAMKEAMDWMEAPDNFAKIKKRFDGESRFAKLKNIRLQASGKDLYIRFVAGTGDAMGMNMLSKGTQAAINWLSEELKDMTVISLSGNFCTDKKPAAINWIDGRGKSVICEATVDAMTVKNVLKSCPAKLAELNKSKNLIGSAMAGSIGGFNAQAANVVTAIFIATGQDPAQNVCSSNCLTQMDVDPNGDLRITTHMPSIEVGTVGGGTILTAQAACLDMMGVRGSNSTSPGSNATQLARIVCAAVLAGELSLMSALAEGHLVKSHLKHNRSTIFRPKEDGSGLAGAASRSCAFFGQTSS